MRPLLITRINQIGVFSAVLLLVVCSWLVLLISKGYGSLQLANTPAGTTVRLNGTVVVARSFTLRPGTYYVSLGGPKIMPETHIVHVGLFAVTSLHFVASTRTPTSIFSQALGSLNESTTPPVPDHIQWLDNNTWLVGGFVPDDTPIALVYDIHTNQWSVGYAADSGVYPHDLQQLPSDVQQYIIKLSAQHG